MQLVLPQPEHLSAYGDALQRGWSPNNLRAEAAQEELAAIAQDPAKFLAAMDDREAQGDPITLPDGSKVARLPGFRRWIWTDTFCGVIGLRWQKGTADLPPHVLGHIGYAVVPWQRGRGLATAALAALLPQARAVGLPYVELTTDPDNRPSQRVIEANGGVWVEAFVRPASMGGKPGWRYRIDLS